jgi:PAS domain S-box-containing protein
LLFPFVIGAALRFGPRGATLLTLTVALLAVAFTVRGGGPFVMHSVPSTDIALLIYVGVLAIAGLFMSPVIARRLKAESALREAHAQLQAVIDSSPLAMYTVDADGNVRSWNPAAATLYGWSADEVMGGPISVIAQDHENQRDIRDRVFRGETLRGIETTKRRKDGAAVTVSMAAAALHDASGRITGAMLIAADLTEMRRLEVQYRQAQKMEAVGRLAGGIAHDFNNLLAGISGSLELLERRLAEGRFGGLERYIIAAQSSARRAAALTQRLLAFSRRQTLDPKPTNINQLISGMEDLIRRTAGPSVEVEVVGAGGIWTTIVDPSQLESALLNLCINARDAMPDGGPHHHRDCQQVVGREGGEGAGASSWPVRFSLRD